MMFYPQDEFEFQVQELIEVGYSRQLAEEIVRNREELDEREYNEWREQEEAIHAHDELERDWDEPYEPDCDSWYDEQYELDTDYL
jgi:hypothetical protein